MIGVLDLLLPHTVQKGTALCGAIRGKNPELIGRLLQGGASAGYVWKPECTTPLAEAIRSQDSQILKQLEDAGAASSLQDELGLTLALRAAIEYLDCATIQTLLSQGSAQPNLNSLGCPMIEATTAGKTEVVLLILDTAISLNVGNLHGILLAALESHNKDIVEAVSEFGLDGAVVSSSSLMEAAFEWGDTFIIEAFLSLATGSETLGDAALLAAVESKNVSLIERLIDKIELDGRHSVLLNSTLFLAALCNGDLATARSLVSKGADPADARAFAWAIEDDRTFLSPLLEMFSHRYPQGLRGFGSPALSLAIRHEDVKLLKRLLGAKFDAESFCDDYTPDLVTTLGQAIMQGHGRCLELVEAVIDCGINPNTNVCKSFVRGGLEHYETALNVAIKTRNETMVDLLLKKGADPHAQAHGFMMRTPLQQACEIGSFKMVRLLLERGASVNEPAARRGGATALQLAAISGSIKIVQVLLERGADVHAPASKNGGRTAFEGAAEHGRITMLKVLWDAVAGFGFTQEGLESASRLAEKNGHGGCVEYIAILSPIPFDHLLDLHADYHLEQEGVTTGWDIPFL